MHGLAICMFYLLYLYLFCFLTFLDTIFCLTVQLTSISHLTISLKFYIYISLLKFSEIRYEIKLEEENEHIYLFNSKHSDDKLSAIRLKRKRKYFLIISELF